MNKFIIKNTGSLILAAACVLNVQFSINMEKALAAVSEKRAQEIKTELQPLIEIVNKYYSKAAFIEHYRKIYDEMGG